MYLAHIGSLFLLTVLILLQKSLEILYPLGEEVEADTVFLGQLIRRYYKCKHKCIYLRQNWKSIMKTNNDFLN